MTHRVVSAGDTRLFAGMGLGVGKARIFAIVVFIGALRLTKPASASVPVFTDQRSTPHCARRLEGRTSTRAATTSKTRRRKLNIGNLSKSSFGVADPHPITTPTASLPRLRVLRSAQFRCPQAIDQCSQPPHLPLQVLSAPKVSWFRCQDIGRVMILAAVKPPDYFSEI